MENICLTWLIFVLFSIPATVRAQCVVENKTYQEGDEITRDCEQVCTCYNGAVGCVSRCPPSLQRPSPECPNPQTRIPLGECCAKWFCDPCPHRTYGLGCDSNCTNCHAGHCNISTGVCPLNPPKPRCLAGFTGSKCLEECPPGSFGADCTRRCGACTTGRKSCHKRTGYCPNVANGGLICQAGYKPRHCLNPCSKGSWGIACQWACGVCAEGAELCHPITGLCPDASPRCSSGYMGEKCKACPPGLWGVECINNCSENCLRGPLECDKRDGACIGGCMDGFEGVTCEELNDPQSDGSVDDEEAGIGVGVGVGIGVTLFVLIIIGVLLYLFCFRDRKRTSSQGSLHSKPSYATASDSSKPYNESIVKKFLGRSDTYELPVAPGVPFERRYMHLERSSTYQLSSGERVYEIIIPQTDWNVDPQCVDIKDTKMVQGCFGETTMGVWKNPADERMSTVVGVKRYSGEVSVTDKLEKIRSAGRCLNILGLLGVTTCPDSGDSILLFEWTDQGNLLSYLKRSRTTEAQKQELEDHRLIKICQEIAGAMIHLAAQHVFPVELAAWTILLNRNLEVKLTGYVKLEDEESQSESKTKAEMRWKAIESILYNTYSTESDVWSYGVLLWEIFSLGETPYMEIQTKDLAAKLRSGHRLKQPDRAFSSMYILMTECWADEPDKRPSFEEISRRLQDMQHDGDEAYEDMSGSGHYVNASYVDETSS